MECAIDVSILLNNNAWKELQNDMHHALADAPIIQKILFKSNFWANCDSILNLHSVVNSNHILVVTVVWLILSWVKWWVI